MPYFKDTANNIHFLSEKDILEGYSSLLPFGCVEITQIEVDALRAPTPAQIAAQIIAEAKEELIAIDLASIRSLREYVASKQDAPQFIKDRETAAQIARAKLTP